MNVTGSVTIAVASLVLFVAGIVFSISNYRRRYQSKYSLKNMFPFEFNYMGHFFDNILGNFLFIFSGLCLLVFYATFKGSRTEGFGIFLFVAGIIVSGLITSLYFVSTKYLKTHIVILTLCFALTFMSIAASALLNLKYYRHDQNITALTGFIYSIVLAVFAFALAMNPKLSFKIQAKVKQTVNDEEAKYERPKWIVVAFTEWMLILTAYLNQIGVIFFLIATKA